MQNQQEELTREREEYLSDTIMSILFELYEDQTGMKYAWEKIESEDESA